MICWPVIFFNPDASAWHRKPDREKTKSMKLLRLIRVLLLPMAVSLPAHAALNVAGALDRIVAVVNENVITELELTAELVRVKDQLRIQGNAIPADDVLRSQLLERMILREIQLQIAERRRIRVNDDNLNQALAQVAAQNNLSLEQFRQALERQGLDYNAYREDMRKEITVGQLQRREVHNRITVTDQEVDDFLANQALSDSPNTEYHLGHILVALPEAASSNQVAEARDRVNKLLSDLRAGADFKQTAIAHSDGQQALEGGDLGWRRAAGLPTLFADKVVKMGKGDLSEPIRSPSGFHLIKLMDKRDVNESHIVKQTHARHILLREDKNNPDIILRRIQMLKERLDAGEDFAELARANSEDSSSAIRGGELGWVNPGDLVPPFEKAMNQLPLNKVSEPVQTRFGWHLIEVLERRNHDSTRQVQRNKAREVIRARKVEPALETWLRSQRDDAYVENRLETP